MFLHILRPGQFFPAIASSRVLLRLHMVCRPGESWRCGQSTNTINTRGRLLNIGSNFTSIQPRLNYHETWGQAGGGLEANVGGAINSTTIVSGTSVWWPYFDVHATVAGAVADGSTDMSLAIGIGVPMSEVRVIAAESGMPYAVGDNLCDPRHGCVLAW